MKELIEIYEKNKQEVDTFIEESIHKLGEVPYLAEKDFEPLFQSFRSLELVYVVDAKTKKQTSPNLYPKRKDNKEIGADREYLIKNLELSNSGFGFTAPYQSKATQNLCITVTKKEGDKVIYMDFRLSELLQNLRLIEKHPIFSRMETVFYGTAGFLMTILATMAIFYSGYVFLEGLSDLDMNKIFKPIITLTLGIAIFDLAKTILTQEVFFKIYKKDEEMEIKTLTKFLFTILIALSIETLMVVFKLAIQEDGDMLNALYLMIGTSFTIVSVSIFIYLTKKTRK